MHKCVGAVIIQHESILLGKRSADRSFYPNVWDVFGGHIESGESHQQALERELVEELGIVPTGYRYLETVSAPSPTEGDRIECHLYLVTEWNGTPANRQPQEHSEIKWFRFGEVLHLELAAPEYERIVQGISSMPEKVMPKSGVGGSASPPPNTPLQSTPLHFVPALPAALRRRRAWRGRPPSCQN